MSVVDDFKGANILAKVAFILLLIASLFTCISYTTTSWIYDDIGLGNYYGLWRLCQNGNGNIPTGCQALDGWANDWFGVVQAFVTFGFFGTLVTFFLIILFIFVGKCQQNGEVGIAAGIIGIITGIMYLIGCIVLAAKYDEYWTPFNNAAVDFKLGYSFALSIVALVLEIVGAVLMIAAAKGGGGKTQSSG